MAAIVKLAPRSRISSFLGVRTEDLDKVRVSRDYMSLEIPVGAITFLSGDDTGTLVKANKRVEIQPCIPIDVRAYNVLVKINPALMEFGVAQCPTILSKGDGKDFKVIFRADKQLDLSTLDYLVKFYLVD